MLCSLCVFTYNRDKLYWVNLLPSVGSRFMSAAASNMSCWSLTVSQRGPFTSAQCLISTASHKTPGSVTQCHLNQNWLELSLAFAFPPSFPLAFLPGRFMNNEWENMQAPALILMELKNRRRPILCAASHCFPMLMLPLPSHSLFLPSLLFLYFSFPAFCCRWAQMS